MPIYEYKCYNCNYKSEKFQKLGENEKDEIICPKCNKNFLKRIISQSGFILKGNGWYKTDYKK
jgi:putative FmdB family regulatory protein